MSPPDRPPSLPPASLLKAARRLLRPLVRLMMQSGLTFPVVAESLRQLFVEIAVNDILTGAKAGTDSRISLLTGVHRKEIRRLRELPADQDEAPDIVTLASQIVARWVGAERYSTAAGQPLPLPRTAGGEAGSSASFDELVASVTTDIRPRAVLDDLLGHGVVFMDALDRVTLNARAFLPRPGGEEQLFYFARNLHDHLAAATANIGAAGVPPFLDRSVHYDRLTPQQAETLLAYARDASMALLLDINRRAQELTGSAPDGTDRGRINAGVYVFGETAPPSGGSV